MQIDSKEAGLRGKLRNVMESKNNKARDRGPCCGRNHGRGSVRPRSLPQNGQWVMLNNASLISIVTRIRPLSRA